MLGAVIQTRGREGETMTRRNGSVAVSLCVIGTLTLYLACWIVLGMAAVVVRQQASPSLMARPSREARIEPQRTPETRHGAAVAYSLVQFVGGKKLGVNR